MELVKVHLVRLSLDTQKYVLEKTAHLKAIILTGLATLHPYIQLEAKPILTRFDNHAKYLHILNTFKMSYVNKMLGSKIVYNNDTNYNNVICIL